jgi:hypothetical protein
MANFPSELQPAQMALHYLLAFRRFEPSKNAPPSQLAKGAAKAAGSTSTNWAAYLSTTEPGGNAGVNARDRIGNGPWKNVKSVVVATNVENLHSASVNINKQTGLTEKGEALLGSGEPGNIHDILTGSDPQGMFSTAGGDTTCGNWTKSSDGSAIVGHVDRSGLGKTTRHMTSWNSADGSRGCS